MTRPLTFLVPSGHAVFTLQAAVALASLLVLKPVCAAAPQRNVSIRSEAHSRPRARSSAVAALVDANGRVQRLGAGSEALAPDAEPDEGLDDSAGDFMQSHSLLEERNHNWTLAKTPRNAWLARSVVRLTFQPPHFQRPFHPRTLAGFARGVIPEPAEKQERRKKEAIARGREFRHWGAMLLLSMLVLGVVVAAADSQWKIDSEVEPNPDLAAMQGRGCWGWCCGGCVFVGCLLVFLTVFINILAMNQEIAKLPTTQLSDGEKNVEVTLREIKHPGERAFEAAFGVALSMAVAALFLLYWRRRDGVRIGSALMSQFVARGATLSLVIAILLQDVGGSMVQTTTGTADVGSGNEKTGMMSGQDQVGVGVFLLMVLAGFSEEFAKVFAVIYGARLSAREAAAEGPAGCTSKMWRVLVESPRALMIAGLCVGFGFMVVENAGYLAIIASTPPMELKDPETGESQNVDNETLRGIRIGAIATRILLNLHPLWAAITAGRVARLTFWQGRATPNLTYKELSWAFFPSALAHAAYDFILVAVPGLLPLLLPPVCYCISFYFYRKEWSGFDDSAALHAGDGGAPRQAEPRASVENQGWPPPSDGEQGETPSVGTPPTGQRGSTYRRSQVARPSQAGAQ